MLTEKQKTWDKYKAEQRAERQQGRGVAVRLASPRRMTARHCPDCPHRWKGHKMAGRCKKGCQCDNGALRRPRGNG